MPERSVIFHGWKVVVAAFVVALFGWGLGFYGPGVYLAALTEARGWDIAAIASAITFYYLVGATVTVYVGDLFDRFGPRRVVTAGALVMAASVVSLAVVSAPWMVFVAFLVMGFGWACMGGAAINLLVAPWFERKCGLAISLALNGASCGGVIIAPALIYLIAQFGFTAGIQIAVAAMLILLLPLIWLWLHRRPEDIGLLPDGRPTPHRQSVPASPAAPLRRASLFGQLNFWSISVPFSLGLAAQVGFLTHQAAYLGPVLGAGGAALAISITTAAAVVGRLAMGLFVDAIDKRLAACGNFVLQSLAVGLMLLYPDDKLIYAYCAMFGLGVGNMITFPPLIVQAEFPASHFSRIVSLTLAINQYTFAFGPGLLGWLRDWAGSYNAALIACMALLTIAAALVLVRSPSPVAA